MRMRGPIQLWLTTVSSVAEGVAHDRCYGYSGYSSGTRQADRMAQQDMQSLPVLEVPHTDGLVAAAGDATLAVVGYRHTVHEVLCASNASGCAR